MEYNLRNRGIFLSCVSIIVELGWVSPVIRLDTRTKPKHVAPIRDGTIFGYNRQPTDHWRHATRHCRLPTHTHTHTHTQGIGCLLPPCSKSSLPHGEERCWGEMGASNKVIISRQQITLGLQILFLCWIIYNLIFNRKMSFLANRILK